MHYNFCRIHRSLQMTPAIAHGVLTGILEIGDIVTLIELDVIPPNRPIKYRKKIIFKMTHYLAP